jgi:predicted CopG family antitoxin
MEQTHNKVRNWSTILVKLDTKRQLDKLKCYSESYDAAIKRLIRKRRFDIVNSQVVEMDELYPKEEIPVKDLVIKEVKVEGTIGK